MMDESMYACMHRFPFAFAHNPTCPLGKLSTHQECKSSGAYLSLSTSSINMHRQFVLEIQEWPIHEGYKSSIWQGSELKNKHQKDTCNLESGQCAQTKNIIWGSTVNTKEEELSYRVTHPREPVVLLDLVASETKLRLPAT